MTLKSKLTKVEFETLPDAVKEHYKSAGEGYALDTDAGADHKAKLDEFRTNNVALLKEQETLKAEIEKFKGIDPEAARIAATKLQELEDQRLLDAGKLDELVEKRTERMRAEGEHKYSALEEANAALLVRAKNSETQLHTKMVEAGIASSINDVGTVRRGAMVDILNRAKTVWQLNDNLELVAMNGDQPIIGADGKSPLSREEYATSLLQEAPFFFEGSQGGGALGSGDKGSTTSTGKVAAGDKTAFGNNLEDIASGKVQVEG